MPFFLHRACLTVVILTDEKNTLSSSMPNAQTHREEEPTETTQTNGVARVKENSGKNDNNNM